MQRGLAVQKSDLHLLLEEFIQHLTAFSLTSRSSASAFAGQSKLTTSPPSGGGGDGSNVGVAGERGVRQQYGAPLSALSSKQSQDFNKRDPAMKTAEGCVCVFALRLAPWELLGCANAAGAGLWARRGAWGQPALYPRASVSYRGRLNGGRLSATPSLQMLQVS